MRGFPPTHLSLFERIRSSNHEVSRPAFDALVQAYWRPSYHYVRLRWQLAAPDSEDVVQAFFAVAFEKRYLERFDPAQARFRTFLRTCLDRFVQHERDAASALKRGGGIVILSLDFGAAEHDVQRHLVAPPTDPDAFFRDETIRALCARVVERLRDDLRDDGRARVFDVFARHDLADSPVSYDDVASTLHLTVAQVTNDLARARRRFREIALDELRALTATDDEFRAEARELFGVEVGG